MDGSPTSKPPAEPGGTQRCAVCDALVSADAEWCGQCFAPLKEEVIVSTEARAAGLGIKITEVSEPGLGQDGDASASGAAAGESPGAKVRLTWPCPACENDNDIELSFCARCGTSFASLMKADEAPVRIEPVQALKWSLVYPGLGHRKAGRGAEGVARGALFTLSLVLLIMVSFSGLGSTSQTLMVSLYLLTTVIVYLGSAAEAYRMARGGSPFVSARTLLWVTVTLLLASIGLLAITATTLVRR